MMYLSVQEYSFMKSRYWYLLVFIFPLSAIIGFLAGGIATYSTLSLLNVILPVAELLCGIDYISPQATKSENHSYYRMVLYTFVMSQLVIMVWGAYAFSHSQSL